MAHFSEGVVLSMKTASFVPIKLNNQRLPGKNLMPLNGRPLCDYHFNALLQLTGFDEKYVYCSSEEIAPYIPDGINLLKRSPSLDTPQTKGMEIIEAFVSDVDADIYMISHVTQPFIKTLSIENALNKVIREGYDSAFSALSQQTYCWFDGKPVNYSLDNIVVTQDLMPVYIETSGFFIFTKEVVTKLRRRIGNNPFMQMVDQFEAIDIDTAEDFKMAEIIANYLTNMEGNND